MNLSILGRVRRYNHLTKCGFHNVKRADECTKCDYVSQELKDVHVKKSREPINDGTRDIGSVPSNILMLRDLDKSVTEKEIYKEIADIIAIHSVRLVKAKSNHQSRCFCFVVCKDLDVLFFCNLDGQRFVNKNIRPQCV